MKSLARRFLEDYGQTNSVQSLYEMSNISQRKTGVDAVIWYSTRNGQHGPRIKLGLKSNLISCGDCVSISIEDEPKVVAGNPNLFSKDTIQDAITWVKKNKDLLMKVWNGEITYDDFSDYSKKI